MKFYKIISSENGLEIIETNIDEWHYCEHEINIKGNLTVFFPNNTEFIFNEKVLDFIKSRDGKVRIDFTLCDYPFPKNHYDTLLSELKNKDVKILSSNLYLNGLENHFLHDPKIKQCDFIFKNSKVFDEIAINQSKFLRPFKFFYLTNHPRYERIKILEFLYNNDLIKHGQVGFPSIEKIPVSEMEMILNQNTKTQKNYVKKLKDENLNLPLNVDFLRNKKYDLNKKHQLWKNGKWVESDLSGGDFNFNLYFNSYFEIFSETYFYGHPSVDYFGSKHQYLQMSEKTIKPICNLIPFYCLSEKNYYNILKDIGLSFESKLYDNLDFDNQLASNSKKIESFNNFIKEKILMKKEDLHGFYYESFSELIHNKYEFMSYFNNQIQNFLSD